jgi:hypothetical protein
MSDKVRKSTFVPARQKAVAVQLNLEQSSMRASDRTGIPQKLTERGRGKLQRKPRQ